MIMLLNLYNSYANCKVKTDFIIGTFSLKKQDVCGVTSEWLSFPCAICMARSLSAL
uniref:Uncharacterized protein n=1 Tax=Arundo donax TaxID=35708 RepID=A0A0A9HHS2_ARUDO